MSTIISGSSPSITFSDSTTQTTAGLTSSTGLTSASPTIASGVLTFPDATTQSSGSGVAKAWVRYNGSTKAILASYNVGSVTYSATGNYIINFANTLTNANYVVTSNSTQIPGTYNTIVGYNSSLTRTSSAVGIGVINLSGGALVDSPYVDVAIFGN